MEGMKVIWNDPPVPGTNGEDGVTEFVTRCKTHGRYANMVYRMRGPRGAILKGWVVGCNKECGEAASGGRKHVAEAMAAAYTEPTEPVDTEAAKAAWRAAHPEIVEAWAELPDESQLLAPIVDATIEALDRHGLTPAVFRSQREQA